MRAETLAPKKEKIESEVAAQIKRIGDKLKSKAEGASLDAEGTHFDLYQGGEILAPSGNQLVYGEDKGLVYRAKDGVTNTETELYPDGSLRKRTESGHIADGTKSSDEFGVNIGQNHLSGYEYSKNGEELNDLSKEQIINRSADALNQLRNKINERLPEKPGK